MRHTPPAGSYTHHSVRRTVVKGFEEIRGARGAIAAGTWQALSEGGDGFYPSRARGARRITQETCEGLQLRRRIALDRTGFDLNGGRGKWL